MTNRSSAPAVYTDLRALFINCIFKPSSHQHVYYGKVGGCLVTGNEDGVKHVAMGVLYSLQHLGYTIPPQPDAGWIGEVGPGPSYGDTKEDGSRVGFDNDFMQRNTTFMTWDLLHFARLLKDAGGVPAYGNQKSEWESGKRFGHPEDEQELSTL